MHTSHQKEANLITKIIIKITATMKKNTIMRMRIQKTKLMPMIKKHKITIG